jgi:hypothetical protein
MSSSYFKFEIRTTVVCFAGITFATEGDSGH